MKSYIEIYTTGRATSMRAASVWNRYAIALNSVDAALKALFAQKTADLVISCARFLPAFWLSILLANSPGD